MASLPAEQGLEPQAGAMLLDRVARNGSASHPYVGAAAAGRSGVRDLADAVHFLCALHGRYPGLIELAAGRVAEPAARNWLSGASDAFAGERGFLARLSVAAGPLPPTPGGAGGEAMIATQRHALQTLAQSERRGCALGAALAFAADWLVVRTLLNMAAERLGVVAPPAPFRDGGALADLADGSAATMPVRRALLFGAEQVALQHRALWDVLQARSEARAG
jgi:hypothetical protein